MQLSVCMSVWTTNSVPDRGEYACLYGPLAFSVPDRGERNGSGREGGGGNASKKLGMS